MIPPTPLEMGISAASRSPLAAFWDQYSFSIGDVDFLWIDVAIGAMVRGEWSDFERRLTEGLACTARAEAERTGLEERVVDEAATAFRYDRDLISGAEMNEWLDGVGVSGDEWVAHLRRGVLRRMWTADMDDVVDRYAASPRQLEAAAVAEGICSGCFDAFERSFAGRAAAVVAAGGAVPPAGSLDSPGLEASVNKLARQHAHWLAMRPERDTRERLSAALHLEECFSSLSERLTSHDCLREVVNAHGLDWTIVEIDTITFDREHAAREAILCVREDGLSLHDVAALARRQVKRTRVFLEEIPQQHRDRLLSVELGQVLGPLVADDRFDVGAVIGRSAPSLDDDRVAERARRAALDSATRRAARELVTRRPKN
jgi:hypothetical protein